MVSRAKALLCSLNVINGAPNLIKTINKRAVMALKLLT
jgi:hypothetical protein